MSSSLAACRFGCVALLAVALCRCGLSSEGSGSEATPDASQGGGSSGYSSGGSLGGPTSSSSSGSGGGAGTSSGAGDGADVPDQGADGAAPTAPPPPADAGAADAWGPDAALGHDAASDANTICGALDGCCKLLQLYGTAASSVRSCMQAAASNSEVECATVLGSLQSVGLCL